MAVARLHPVLTKRGRTNVVGQVIAAPPTVDDPPVTWTLSIALGRSDFTHGFVMLGQPNSVTAAQRRTTANIYCTTVLADAVAQSTSRKTTTFRNGYKLNYTVIEWAHKGYFYDVDSNLSDAFFSTNANRIKVTSAQINGSNLEIVFTNTSLVTSATLTVDVEYRVQRIVV